MNSIALLSQLNQVSHVKARETEDHQIHVTNALNVYYIDLNPQDVIDAEFIASPTGVKVLKLYFNSGGIIITPDNYVFNVEQDEMIQVDDAPPMCSITEMIDGFKRYILNPMPSDNLDNCVALFYIHYYIVKSAKSKGFKVDSFMDELDAIDQKFGLYVSDVEKSSDTPLILASHDALEQSALQGNQADAMKLAEMYLDGAQVNQSKADAFAWVIWAKMHCDMNVDIHDALSKLYNALNDTLSKAARKRAEKILAEHIERGNYRMPVVVNPLAQATTILDLAGEGGGYTIFGEQHQGQWRLWHESSWFVFDDDGDEATPASLPNAPTPKPSPCYVQTLDEALEPIKSYWPDLYPIQVHPAFAKAIWQRVITYWRDHGGPRAIHAASKWSQLCVGREINSLDELDLFAWDLPAHWHGFASALSKTLVQMAEDQFLILLCKGSNRFVQVATQHKNIRVEASSNYCLSGRDALSAKDIKALRRLGWLPPTGTLEQATPERDPDGSPNYFLELPLPVDFTQLTTLAVKTLSVVMGVPHDGYLAYTAFGVNGGGDVSYPGLGIKREVTDPNLRMEELAERLLSVLQEASGCAALAFDDDGDVALDMAGQRCLIRLVGQPPMVRFYLPLLVGRRSDKKLLEQLNQLNLRGAPVCHVWANDKVFAVQDIPAWPLQAQHVEASLALFTDTASKSALWLQSEFGAQASVLNPSNTSH